MCISLLINKEVSMAMMSEETMRREAQYLLSRMSTYWGEYDFGETSEVADHRVPKLVFDADVKIIRMISIFVRYNLSITVLRILLRFHLIYILVL